MKPRILILALSCAASSHLCAQDGPPPHGHRPPSPLIIALDSDKNHIISPEEIEKSPTALLTLDKDGDGALSRDELRPQPPKRDEDSTAEQKPEPPADAPEGKGDPGKHPLPPILKALDTDKNGELSAEEIKNAATSLRSLDKNEDGQLTPDEFDGPKKDGHGPRDERPDSSEESEPEKSDAL
ncbi:MAG: hypothetical protein QM680_02285 [Luteolibacter sp.]